MKEPYKKGVATHLDPESCAGVRKDAGEALTGAPAGQPLSSEICSSSVPTAYLCGEGNTKGDVQRELPFDAAESKTLSMQQNSLRENREAPSTSPSMATGTGRRSHKPKSDMHVPGESDRPIVPAKRANQAEPSVAESVEGRGLTKGNASHTEPTPDPEPGKHGLGVAGIRQVAKRDKNVRFTALLHHVTPELLTESYHALNRTAVPGIDEVTWKAYGEDLENRLAVLHGRIHRGAYRALPSKRAWIPKADGRQRPLGIAALEDKIVQQAIRTVLEAIYEEDFVRFSYGFRPKRGSHNALDALWVGIKKRKVNWVLDADIRGFFDAIDHAWLMKFLQHRIADRRVLRLIEQWLKAGVLEDGQWSESTEGTPQGSVISPLLANVYLHYAFDLWVNQWRRTKAEGDVIVVRYADDFVLGFQNPNDARLFLYELRKRLGRFHLELHPDKTRLIEFGRLAAKRRQERRAGKPETFDFLGFTHYCGTTRKGAFQLKRKPIAKRMRATLTKIKQELRKRRHARVCALGAWLRSVVQGWYRYYAVPDSSRYLRDFRTQVNRLWLRALQRRSQMGRRRWTWKRMQLILAYWIPQPRILHPYPTQRLHVT